MPPHRIDCHVHYHASAFAERLLSHQGTTGANVPIRGFVASRPAWHDLNALTEVMDQTEVELAPSAIAKHRIHDEAAARADRRRRLNMKESASVGGLYSLRFLLTLLMIGHIPILARHLR